MPAPKAPHPPALLLQQLPSPATLWFLWEAGERPVLEWGQTKASPA